MSIDINFLSAGNAYFTVSNGTKHYTFRIRKHEDIFFIALLTGSDNTADYTYLGVYNKYSNEVKLTQASKYHDNSEPVRVLRWAINVLKTNKRLPNDYSIDHAGKCGRCGRMLTVPESIESGYGPECIKLI